jgi:Bacterial regulatory protein, arsR family
MQHYGNAIGQIFYSWFYSWFCPILEELHAIRTGTEGRDSSTAVFSGSRWLDIAVALCDQPRTLAQCAHVLGVSSGTIYRQVRDMVEAGLVEHDGEVPGHGTRFHLAPHHRDTLDHALGERQSPGVLQRLQPVLFLIDRPSILDVARALGPGDISAVIAWVVQMDDDTLILGINREAPPVARARLRAALEAAHISCQAGRVSEVHSGRAWRDMMAATRDAAL